MAHRDLHESFILLAATEAKVEENIIAFKYARSGFCRQSEVARGTEQEGLRCNNIFVL